jgi:hypothetical protein
MEMQRNECRDKRKAAFPSLLKGDSYLTKYNYTKFPKQRNTIHQPNRNREAQVNKKENQVQTKINSD